MVDRPIIFSAPMIRALLDGRKTMTRRLTLRQVNTGCDDDRAVFAPSPWRKVQPGDRLWVRENFAEIGTVDPGWFVTQADYPDCAKRYGFDCIPGTLKEAGDKWRPSIHMPRRLSRLTLIVTETKIERLQEISGADAIAEGIVRYRHEWRGCEYPLPDVAYEGFAGSDYRHSDPADAFADLWRHIHGADAWNANPEVVAITFRVIRANIDNEIAGAA